MEDGGRLDGLAEVVLELGCGLVQDDLEGLEYLLTQMARLGKSAPQLAAKLEMWSEHLQKAVAEHWGGLRLATGG